MWRIFVGFLLFAAVAFYFLFKAGDKVDMGGEAGAHMQAASEQASASASAAVTAPVLEASASSASTPASDVDAASASK